MRQCPVIVDITFDEKSQKSIEEINKLYDLKKVGKWSLLIGHLFTIFGGNLNRGASGTGVSGLMNAVPKEWLKNDMVKAGIDATKTTAKVVSSEVSQTSWSIYQANWQYFFESFSALDRYTLKLVEEIAYSAAYEHQQSPKEYLFWKSVYLGCQANVK